MAAKTIKRITYILIGFILILLGGQAFLPTYAAVQNYSNVLTDLQKDESFNAADYKSVADDYSLQVIQIAESTDGELFLYTYQPSQPTQYLVATSVNMSLSESVDGTELYDLTLLSSSGVFCKYLVNGVTVAADETRFYNISSIYRAWIQGIDEPPADGQTINEVAFKVGQLWKITKENGGISYDMIKQNVVEITDKFVGYILYPDGYYLTSTKNTASHFVAFDIDLKIENLIEADLTYITQSFSQNCKNGYYYEPTYGELSDPIKTTLYADNYGGSANQDFIWHTKFTWKKIQSKDEFLKTESDRLSQSAKNNLANKKWVLRFFDTNYATTHSINTLGDYWSNTSFTMVNSVSILRLKFQSDGTTYNLGVVDNKQTGSIKPVNPTESNFNFFTYIWNCLVKLFTGKADLVETLVAIFVLFVVVALLPILGFIFPTFGRGLLWLLKGVAYVIKYVFIAIWYVISAPFKLIAWLVNRRQGGGDGD